jgi:hypothetical protein
MPKAFNYMPNRVTLPYMSRLDKHESRTHQELAQSVRQHTEVTDAFQKRRPGTLSRRLSRA